jgi:hypothetical protein
MPNTPDSRLGYGFIRADGSERPRSSMELLLRAVELPDKGPVDAGTEGHIIPCSVN